MALRIVVIGSGPAGLWAAFAAAGSRAEVTILESRKQIGSKLLISGAGKCNFTNVLSGEEQARRFGRNWRFMLPAYQELPPEMLIKKLADLGVKGKCEDNFHYFPASERAADILNALLHQPGIQVIPEAAATEIGIENQQVKWVKCADNRQFPADRVIIASGGISYPQLGGNMKLVYQAAEKLGHKITPCHPALAGLQILQSNRLGELSGLVLDNAKLTFKLRKTVQTTGIMLFTHRGISGPAVLDISGEAAEYLSANPQLDILLQWRAGETAESWEKFFADARQLNGKKQLATVLGNIFTAKSAALLLDLAQIPADTICAALPADGKRRLIILLTAMPLTATATEGWCKAMVTKGGVCLKEVTPDTLESKLHSGVFFAGEVLDLAGPCGGYNIQWASSSGYLAGKSAAAKQN